MMIHFLRHQRGAGHEPEGLVEVCEDVLAGNGAPPLDLAPRRKALQRRGKRGGIQPLPHRAPAARWASAVRGYASSSTYGPPPTEFRDENRTKRSTGKGPAEKPPRRPRYSAISGAEARPRRAMVTCGVYFRPSGGRPMRCNNRSCSAWSSRSGGDVARRATIAVGLRVPRASTPVIRRSNGARLT